VPQRAGDGAGKYVPGVVRPDCKLVIFHPTDRSAWFHGEMPSISRVR
jgi:hypothetical protein